jgi:hypothetical protein
LLEGKLKFNVAHLVELLLRKQYFEIVYVDRNLPFLAGQIRTQEGRFRLGEELSHVLRYAVPAENTLAVYEPEWRPQSVCTNLAFSHFNLSHIHKVFFNLLKNVKASSNFHLSLLEDNPMHQYLAWLHPYIGFIENGQHNIEIFPLV